MTLNLDDLSAASYAIEVALMVVDDSDIHTLKEKITELILDEKETVKIGTKLHYHNNFSEQDDPNATVTGLFDEITFEKVSAYRKCYHIAVKTTRGIRWITNDKIQEMIDNYKEPVKRDYLKI